MWLKKDLIKLPVPIYSDLKINYAKKDNTTAAIKQQLLKAIDQ